MPWRRILFWLAALGCALAVLWWGGNVLLSRQVEQLSLIHISEPTRH